MDIMKTLVSFLLFSMLVSSCAHFQKSSYGSYAEAEKAFSRGKYEKAIMGYRDYLEQNPGGSMAVIAEYYIGKSYAAMGMAGEAEKVYRDVIEKYPQSSWAGFAQKRLDEVK
ncbi:MAG: Outer membrane protein assembly factor BamD [Candidatus Omnitrophica bacterium ADurb.Bin277]|nr:MAG: Outer membrane protein assembly factor BamD [Candidatus Omnitrophica bacterium ADurb.Bin277]